MSTVERGKPLGRFARSQAIRNPHCFVACTDKRPIYVSFVSKAILWDRGQSNYTGHSVPHHGSLPCSRFLCHMKARPEDFKPPYFPSSKSKPLPPCQAEEKRRTQALTAPRLHTLDGNIGFSTIRRKRDVFLQGPTAGLSTTAVAPRLPLHSTPLPTIKPRPSRRNSPDPERCQDVNTPIAPQSLQTHSVPEDTVYEENEAPLLLSTTDHTDSHTKLCQSLAVQEPPQSPAILSHGSLSDISRPPSSLFSHSLDLTSDRSSVLSYKTSAESRSSSPGGIICSPPVHSSSELQTPVAPCLASLPRHSPTNLSISSLISTKSNGQTKAPSPYQTAASEPKSGGANVLIIKSTSEEAQTGQMTASGQDSSVPVSVRSSCRLSPQMSIADSLSLQQTPSPPGSCLGSQWPVLPPISTSRDLCNTAASCSSEVSCSQSHVFDELDAIAPLSVSCSSLDQPSESSHCSSKNTDVSPGLAALTVGCDSGNLGSLSRVQLLLLNRQESDAVPSPFGFDEDLLLIEDYHDLEIDNGVWRPLTAGSISEKCGSMGKVHKNKLNDDDGCSGSPCSWIIDPSPSYDMLKSSDSPCNSSLGSTEDAGAPIEEQSNYPGVSEEDKETYSTTTRSEEERGRKMEEKKTKVLKMLSKLQDDTPHQSTSNKGRSNFEDFDFLAKYCIFNQEKLAEYKRAFEEEDSDGDGYISCLQLLFALKNIIPPELLSEEEEIYVYKILEMVDFRVSDGLVDLRLFAVIASLAQKIATMDEFMRSLISSIDFRSLEVRLFKAKKLFLFLLEEQAGEGTSQQKFISPEQLILELKAGGICLEQEAAIRVELQRIPPLDLLDFLAYLPLFMFIHRSVIANPLDDSSNL